MSAIVYRRGYAAAVLSALALAALASLVVALLAGTIEITLAQLWAVLDGSERGLSNRVVLELRLPRALSAFTVGAMLALAGVLLQVLLRNPLADPYILGVSGGAAAGALGAMLFGLAAWLVSGAAMLGALASMILVFALAHGRGEWSSTRLLLTGVVLAAGWAALVSFILTIAPERQLRGMLFWLMGDLGQTVTPGWAALVLCAALVLTLFIARSLNLLARGELQAMALGVNVAPLRTAIYVTASALAASAVTLAGSVGFVGLVVPHMLRLAGVTDHRLLVPCAGLLGGTLLTLADTLARTAIAPRQLPVGVLTALIGVPLFLALLYHGTARRRT